MPAPPSATSPSLYIRDVPQKLKRQIIASANASNKTLNAYLLEVLEAHESRKEPRAARVRASE